MVSSQSTTNTFDRLDMSGGLIGVVDWLVMLEMKLILDIFIRLMAYLQGNWTIAIIINAVWSNQMIKV